MARPKNETRPEGGKIYRHTFRLDERQQVEFENMLLKAGQHSKTQFILSRIFG